MKTMDYFEQYDLLTPNRPPSKHAFIIGLIVVFLLLVLLTSGTLQQTAKVFVGSLSFLVLLTLSFYYGYSGLIATLIVAFYGVYHHINLWRATGNTFNFGVVSVHLLNLASSAIISHGVEKQKKRKELLEWLSVTDGLTGLYNHRYFYRRLEEEIARATRNNESLGLCMIDIDKLKEYNDTEGHTAGDEVIRQTALIIRENSRKSDIVCRYGGDEFAVIMPNSDKDDVIALMERVKEVYYEQDISHCYYGAPSRLTLSIGFSIFPSMAKDLDQLISQADTALYHAKSKGRNRIEMFREVFGDVDNKISLASPSITESMKALIRTLSVKDKYAFGHPERVANYSVLLGKALNMPEEKLELLRIGALLHDIGNIEIPDTILNKKDRLTPEEFELVKEHPKYSVKIIKSLSNMDTILDDIKHHHERFDGRGYPDGLGENQIPIGARIIAIADAFDAMQSDRPYRKALTPEESVRELIQHSGTQFDKELVQLFIKQLCKPQGPYFELSG